MWRTCWFSTSNHYVWGAVKLEEDDEPTSSHPLACGLMAVGVTAGTRSSWKYDATCHVDVISVARDKHHHVTRSCGCRFLHVSTSVHGWLRMWQLRQLVFFNSSFFNSKIKKCCVFHCFTSEKCFWMLLKLFLSQLKFSGNLSKKKQNANSVTLSNVEQNCAICNVSPASSISSSSFSSSSCFFLLQLHLMRLKSF